MSGDSPVELIARTELVEAEVQLSAATRSLLQRIAEERGWSFEDALRVALAYGLAMPLNDLNRQCLAGKVNDLDGLCASLRFELTGLREEEDIEQMHVNAVRSSLRLHERQAGWKSKGQRH